jgi:release factor glutamine methyltransferase
MLNPPPGRLLGWLTENLTHHSETAALDASVLLAAVFEKPRAWVLAHPEAALSRAQEELLTEAVHRLQAGEPFPYVLGSWEFFGLRFKVSPAALIPRPETELLVEQALIWLKSHPTRRRALDIGTGTGCIATSLVVNCPDLVCTAVDISTAALALARENTSGHQTGGRIGFVQANLLDPFAPASCDLLCANLPYIPSTDLPALRVALHEPRLALDGGPDGITLIDLLVEQTGRVLAPGGVALLEIEERQGPAALALAKKALPGAKIAILSDLAGKARLLRAEISTP